MKAIKMFHIIIINQATHSFIYHSNQTISKHTLDPMTGQLTDSYETYVEFVSQKNLCTVPCIVYTDTMYHT